MLAQEREEAPVLTYDLQRESTVPLYEQLYRLLRRDIEQGHLKPWVKLPPKREFARHLGVSVITIEGAYRQLVAEGYAYAQERRGHFVASLSLPSDQERRLRRLGLHPTEPPLGEMPLREVLLNGERQKQGPLLAEQGYFPVERGCFPAEREAVLESGGPRGDRPDGDADGNANGSQDGKAAVMVDGVLADVAAEPELQGVFPYKTWARATRQVLAEESEASLQRAASPAGALRLRRALAAYLRSSRGIEAHPDQIVVGAGAQTLYSFVVQGLGRRRTFAIENPGYPRLAQVYRSNDVGLVAVPLDRDGLRMTFAGHRAVSVVHCMPSHQLPTGTVMAARRRRELLGWLEDEHDHFLIEDDYDCEFRMTGRPIPAIQSLDRTGRVIYLNTFTKSLGPTFRIGYMVLSPELAAVFRERLGFYACTVGVLDQLTLARLIETGEYERHVNRQRTRYRRAQDALLAALRTVDETERLTIRRAGAGLHFLLEVDGAEPLWPDEAAQREQAIALAAASRGLRLVPLCHYDTECAAGLVPSKAAGAFSVKARPATMVVSLPALPAEDPAALAQVLVQSCLD